MVCRLFSQHSLVHDLIYAIWQTLLPKATFITEQLGALLKAPAVARLRDYDLNSQPSDP